MLEITPTELNGRVRNTSNYLLIPDSRLSNVLWAETLFCGFLLFFVDYYQEFVGFVYGIFVN